jgi:hypothetical protein
VAAAKSRTVPRACAGADRCCCRSRQTGFPEGKGFSGRSKPVREDRQDASRAQPRERVNTIRKGTSTVAAKLLYGDDLGQTLWHFNFSLENETGYVILFRQFMFAVQTRILSGDYPPSGLNDSTLRSDIAANDGVLPRRRRVYKLLIQI